MLQFMKNRNTSQVFAVMTDIINYKIVDSISKIKKQEWDVLFGDIPEGYQFYKALEESVLKNFPFIISFL